MTLDNINFPAKNCVINLVPKTVNDCLYFLLENVKYK